MPHRTTNRHRLGPAILPAAAASIAALLILSTSGCTTRVPELLTSNRGPIIKPARLVEPTPIDRFADVSELAAEP